MDERPGVFPFTRGDSASGPDPDGWSRPTTRGPEDGRSTRTGCSATASRVPGGIPSLLLAMDLPTQVGLDPDDELAVGEVGRIGVAVTRWTTRWTCSTASAWITSSAAPSATRSACTRAAVRAAGRAGGVGPGAMRIVLQNDPLKEYTGRGTQIFRVGVALALSADVVEYVHQVLGPTWKPQNTCSTQMRWGGVSAAQEIGLGLASLMTYVTAAQARGIEPAAYRRAPTCTCPPTRICSARWRSSAPPGARGR